MAGLCILDEKILRDQLAESIHDQSKIRVALIPDIDTIQWHHAREEFTAREMLGTEPDVKGAIATSEGGKRVWCVWTRTFGSTGAGNTLNILRLVIEGERDSERNPLSANEDGTTLKTSSLSRITACAAVLRAAQLEAAKWDMKDVQFWNPSRLAVLAARGIDTSSQVIHRDEENLASLRWHGKADDRDHVEWIGNEKYGWWFVSSVIVQKIY